MARWTGCTILALGLGLAASATSTIIQPTSALAAPRREQAAIDQANRGIKLLQEGRWEDAIRELDKALPMAVEVGSVPLIASCHRALAKAHDALGHVETALRHYRAYLDANLDEALRRKEVEDRIAALEQATRAELEVSVDVAHATVLVDGAAVTRAGPIALAAGVHQLRVEAEGYTPHEEQLTLRGGQQVQVVVRLRPIGPVGPVRPPIGELVEPPPEPPGAGPWPWVTIAGGALVAGLGAWLVAEGDADWTSVEEARDDDPPTLTRAQADALVEDGRGKRTGGFVAVGAGAGLVVTGLVLLLVDDPPARASEGVRFGSLGLTTTF